MSESPSAVVTWLCIAVAVLEGFELQVAGVAAPRFATVMEMDADALGLFFSASTFGLLFGALGGGWVADRKGRLQVLAGSVIAFGAGSILTGLSANAEQLVLTRFLTGLGLGGALPNLLALTAENADPGRQKRAVALLYCGVPIGGMLVSLAGATSGDAWRQLFIAGGLVSIVVGVLLWRQRSIVKLTASVRPSQGSGIVSSLFSDGRAVPTLLVWTSFCGALIILYLVLNWLPMLLSGMGFSATEALIAQIAFNTGGFFSCLLTAPLLDTRRAWLIALGSFSAVPVLLYTLSAVAAPLTCIVLSALLGGAILTTQSFLYSITPTIYPRGTGGIGTGTAIAWGRIGSIIGPLYGAVLLSGSSAERDVFVGIIPIALVAGIAAVALSFRTASLRA